MEIRLFDTAYQKELIDFILQIQREEFGLDISLSDQPDLLQIEQHYPKSFWLALSDGKVVGCIGLVSLTSQNVALKKMFVKAEIRKLGIGKRLVETFLGYCYRNDKQSIYLGTNSQFQTAQHFYKKIGFKEIEKAQLPQDFPILDVDNRFYHYQLSHQNN